MSHNEKILSIFRDTNALLEGHFVLSSGRHTSSYFQCAKVLQYPEYLTAFSIMIADEFEKYKPDVVISPAIGGIVLGTEVGTQIGSRTIFAERKKGKMVLRRGFSISPGEKVLIVEDVITTGKSSIECSKLVEDAKGKTIGYGCIIDRSNGKSNIKQKIVSQIELNIPSYSKENIPDNLSKIEAVKPGSRKL